jgi:L-fuculose-phosphate aldolase
VTASGCSLGNLKDEDLVLLALDTGAFQGARKPSIEAELHRRIYLARPDAGAILHAQPPHATIIACAALIPEINLIPESIACLGKPCRIPYEHPGSGELAGRVSAASRESEILILENHGILCFGRDLEEAVTRAETLEFLSRLQIEARAASLPLRPLDQEQAQGLLRHLRSLGAYGKKGEPGHAQGE